LGIDPGLSGALALLDTGLNFMLLRDMPVVPIKKGRMGLSAVLVAEIIEALEPDHAFVENVHAMKGQGISSAFNFGMGFGIILGALGAARVPYQFVTPNEWKKHFRLTKDKGLSRATAARLYPVQADLFSRAKDDGRAEAALIATFGLSLVVSRHHKTH
jgi:crossover junction endodeoxyribonuclease RuvC